MTQANIEVELKTLREHVLQLQQQQEHRKRFQREIGISCLILGIVFFALFFLQEMSTSPTKTTTDFVLGFMLIVFGGRLFGMSRRWKVRDSRQRPY